MPKEKTNPMSGIRLEKVTLNIGIGPTEDKYEAAKSLLNKLTGHEAVPAKAKKRKPEFGIKEGQTIGAVVTLRKSEADSMLKRALEANSNTIKSSAIAGNTVNFGINEYIFFSGVKYDPHIGMLGLNVNAAFSRKGMRVERRRAKKGSVERSHKEISHDELLSYMQDVYKVKLAEEA